MNDTAKNVGGWPATSMRTFVNNDIYNLLPSDLKNGIMDTTVVSSHGSNDSSNFTLNVKMYLLAPTEIYSNFNDSSDTAKDLTRQLDYYTIYTNDIKKFNSTATRWWLRSANTINSMFFYYVRDTGGYSGNRADTASGVSPAFRIG